jgi:hypothetical protein
MRQSLPHIIVLVALKERDPYKKFVGKRDVAAAYKKLLKQDQNYDLGDWLITYTRAKL